MVHSRKGSVYSCCLCTCNVFIFVVLLQQNDSVFFPFIFRTPNLQVFWPKSEYIFNIQQC